MPIASTPIGSAKPPNFRLSIIGSADSYIPPRFSLPLCKENSVLLPENDDEAERQEEREKEKNERKKSNVIEKENIGRKKSIAASSFFSDAEKKEHYQLCMKLTSENKVNAKNAFALHLIEYMYEMVMKSSKVPNFQMASMTLMASAKLYGLRVDTLHANTLKVAGVLSIPIRKTNLPQEEETEMDHTTQEQANSFSDQNEEGQDTQMRNINKRGRKTKKLKCQIAKNTNMIDEVFEIEEEPHPKYHEIVEMFEDEEVSLMGTIFCHLCVTCDDGTIAVADKSVTYVSETKQPFVCTAKERVSKSLKKFFRFARSFPKLSPTLSIYSANECRWPLDSDHVLPRKDSPRRMEMAKYLTVHVDFKPFVHPVMFKDTDHRKSGGASVDASNIGCFDSPSVNVCGEAHTLSSSLNRNFNAHNTHVSNAIYSMVSPHSPLKSHISVKNLTSCLLSPNAISEYSTLDPVLEAAILGRKVIKEKPVKKELSESGMSVPHIDKKDKREARAQKEKEQFKFSFDKCEPCFIKQRLRQGGNQITVSDQAQTEWIMENTTLPVRIYDPKNTGKLFLKPHSVRKPQKAVVLNKSIGNYDYNNPVDREFCVESAQVDSYCDGVSASLSNEEKCDTGTITLKDTSLAPEPVQVQRDFVSYARVAKYINQTEVKRAVWLIIKDDFDKKKQLICPESTSDVHVIDFIKLYRRLECVLPADQFEVMSIPIAFTALLHIVNENALYLKNTEDLIRLSIMSSKPV